MGYRKYKLALLFRVAILFLLLISMAYAISVLDLINNLPLAMVIITPLLLIALFTLRSLFKFTLRRFHEMDDFFEAVKYRDFSRWFAVKSGPPDIRELHAGFNKVNETFKQINKEKEEQHLYLQKILELVDTGIVAYNIETGRVLWINDSFKKILNLPTLKSTEFVRTRKPKLYTDIFETNHKKGDAITIDFENSKVKILITSSLFNIKEEGYKLIVIQNIDQTLNKNESDAWKKLLSVMTHEIMNSIAPISSLAETLQTNIQLSIKDPEKDPLEIRDLDTGIESIKKRSEGLLKFAKTYRSLNKVTTLNLEKVFVNDLFENIKILMKPSLDKKGIELLFEIENSELHIEMDRHLIEQVLINLLLNAIEASKENENPKILLSSKKDVEGNSIIRVTDNGKGIPDEFLDNIFVPFFTTKKNGSGIGLSLCKQIMLLHKGEIQIKTIKGKGTAMSLVF